MQELAFETDGDIGRLFELETNYWRRKAGRYHVPTPERGNDEDSNWKFIEDRQDGHKYWYLTEIGIFAVRKLIREEEKYKRDNLLAYIAALTGVGGVVIGILSSIHRK